MDEFTNEKNKLFQVGPSKEEYKFFFNLIKNDSSIPSKNWYSFIEKTGNVIETSIDGEFVTEEINEFITLLTPYRDYLIHNTFSSKGINYNPGLFIFRIEEKYLDSIGDVKKILSNFEGKNTEYSRSEILEKILIPATFKLEYILKSIIKIKKKENNKNQEKVGRRSYIRKEVKPFVMKGVEEKEFTVGNLRSWSDGRITYKDNELDLEPRYMDLCRLFMRKHNELVTHDDIKEHIISQVKRASVDKKTTNKYVSDLRKILQKIYGEQTNPIKSKSKQGYIFTSPEKVH